MPRLFEIWRNNPLYRLVLEELVRRPSGISERDLLDTIRKEHGYDVSKAELYEVLMRLELRGYIVVDRVGRDLIVKISPNIDKLI